MQAPPNRVWKRRALAAVSVGVNVLLLGQALELSRASNSSAFPPRARPATLSPVRAPVRVRTESAPAAPAVFRWDQLESNDLRAYAANLRAVGCPEKTVRDILLPLIDRAFRSRTPSAVIPDEADFWTGGEKMNASRVRLAQARQELGLEKVALVKELFGVYLDSEAIRDWHAQAPIGVILGFLSEGRPELLMSAGNMFADEAKGISDVTLGVLTPEDKELIRGLYGRAKAEAASFLSPAELEELELRVTAVVAATMFGERVVGLRMSGTEVRELMRALRSAFEPLAAQLVATQGRLLDQAPLTPEFEARLLAVLGTQRFDTYQRLQEPSFRELWMLSDELQIPEAQVVKAHDFQRAYREEETRIGKEPGLTPEQRNLMLKEARTNSEAAVQAVLGEANFKKLQEKSKR